MTFALRDFAGTSECLADDGSLITVTSFFEGPERRIMHRACNMREAIWCQKEAAFRLGGDARHYRPLEVLPILSVEPVEDERARPR